MTPWRRQAALRPELPPALDPVLARGLAKDKASRYPSCGELVAAAREALGEGSAPPAPETPPGPATRKTVTVVAVLLPGEGGETRRWHHHPGNPPPNWPPSCSVGTGERWNDLSPDTWWGSSAIRSCTRTTPCGPCGRRARSGLTSPGPGRASTPGWSWPSGGFSTLTRSPRSSVPAGTRDGRTRPGR